MSRAAIAIALVAALMFPESTMSQPRPASQDPAPWMNIVGVAVTPHERDASMPYPQYPEARPGAWVTLFVRNDSLLPAAPVELRFNGAGEFPLLASGEWLWFETPASRRASRQERLLPPGALDVWTFNAIGEQWAAGSVLEVAAEDYASRRQASVQVPLEAPALRAELLVARDRDGDHSAETLVLHVTNMSDAPASVTGAKAYLPAGGDGAERALFPAPLSVAPGSTTSIGTGERGVVVLTHEGPLPRVFAAVEVEWQLGDGRTGSTFAASKLWPLRVEVGAGWLGIAGPNGKKPIESPEYLDLLKRLNVTTAIIGEEAGYSGTPLEERHALRMMSRLQDIDRHNEPAQWPRVHGIEFLGEPQYHGAGSGRTSHQVWQEFAPYRRSAHPTTLTLSEEAGFALYAGVADFVHFDAYRISAPHADSWGEFERFADRSVREWAAPIESVGAKMRTLQAVNRPLPAAAWSQAIHDGWGADGDRTRPVPTGDEVRSQAWQVLAAGAKSLYWFSLQRDSVVTWADALEDHARIGREVAVLEPLLAEADTTWWERQGEAHRPMLEVNALASPEAVVVVAQDLDYEPNEAPVLEWTWRPVDVAVPASAGPWILGGEVEVLRLDGQEILEQEFTRDSRGGLYFRGEVHVTGVWVVSRRGSGVGEALRARLQERLALERGLGPAPWEDDAALEALARSLREPAPGSTAP